MWDLPKEKKREAAVKEEVENFDKAVQEQIVSRNGSAINVQDVSSDIKMDMYIDDKHRKTAAFKSQSVVDRVTTST